MERYRMAKAQIAELELERKRGGVIDAPLIRTVHGRMAALLRGAGEQLERLVSPDAAEILNGALDECDREIATVFKEDEGDDSDRD